jgi:hypothetical protein
LAADSASWAAHPLAPLLNILGIALGVAVFLSIQMANRARWRVSKMLWDSLPVVQISKYAAICPRSFSRALPRHPASPLQRRSSKALSPCLINPAITFAF